MAEMIFEPIPVKLGDAAKYFVNNANYYIKDAINLLPLLKQGYCLKSALIPIVLCHIHNNQLDCFTGFIPDRLFIKSFSSTMPSLWYRGKDNTNMVNNHNLNTFQIIKQNDVNFNHKMIKCHYLQKMISLNMEKINLTYCDQNFIDQLCYEADLIKEFYSLSDNNKNVVRMEIC